MAFTPFPPRQPSSSARLPLTLSLRDAQLTELKKYAVFSKVTIAANDDLVLLGVAGFQARAALAPLFAALPDAATPVVSEGATSLLWFEHPGERFLLVTDVDTANRVTDALRGEAQFNNSQQWLALNIEAGLPVIDSANSGQFIPQATNLQALGGISFKKGCYTGQEMVARAKFRGANKRALWTLSGTASRVPEAGEDLELKMGDNWRRTGTVLAAVQLDDGSLMVQVVMNNDMEPDSVFRVRDDAGSLSIKPLPYSAHRQLHCQLIDHDKRQPAHGQIGHQRQNFKAVRDGQLKQDP